MRKKTRATASRRTPARPTAAAQAKRSARKKTRAKASRLNPMTTVCPKCKRTVSARPVSGYTLRLDAHDATPGRACPHSGKFVTFTPGRRTNRPAQAKTLGRKPKKTLPGAARPRRRNSAELEAAAALAEGFHGRPARRVREIEELDKRPAVLADLGPLKELQVILDSGKVATITLSGVTLAATPEGNQIYFKGGDQSLDLARLGLANLERDHMEIGRLWKLTYSGKKASQGFERALYEHEMGEERGGIMPTLAYDTINRRMYVVGGSYHIKGEWMRN